MARAMLDALVGTSTELETFKRLLVDKTDGNPFFLEELVQALVETGALSGKPGAYRAVVRFQTSRYRPRLKLLASRIDRLSPVDKRLLQSAVVIGDPVPIGILEAVAGLPPDELRQGLERLQTSEFLYQTRLFPELEYTFKHALIRDVSYQTLPSDRRDALHASALSAGSNSMPNRLPRRPTGWQSTRSGPGSGIAQ